MRLHLPTLGLLFASLALGCAGEPTERVERSAEGDRGTLAVVQLERWDEGVDAPSHLISDARVARYRGIERVDVERLLGGHGLQVGRCGSLGSLPDAVGSEGTSVELLDVGGIDVLLGDETLLLSPRVFPAVAGAAHGMFYVADLSLPAQAEYDEYVLHAPGNEGLGAFDVALPPPGFVEDVVVAGQPLGYDSQPFSVARGSEVVVTWAGLDPRDTVELEWTSGGQVLTCVAQDKGSFAVSATTLGHLPADADGQLTVRRVRWTRFDMQDVDSAYVRAVAASSYPLGLN